MGPMSSTQLLYTVVLGEMGRVCFTDAQPPNFPHMAKGNNYPTYEVGVFKMF